MEKQRRNSHFINEIVESTECVIDQSFSDTLLTHIIGNYDENVQAPLFLAIQGNPGEGKTFQTLNICKKHNLKICYYSGAELSGNYEKDSIIELSEDYTRACNYYNDGEYCAIIIDDFHLSPASTKNGVGTTINSQLLTGYLMNLCDKVKSKQIESIPIILLGNTFKDVYDPLKRDGRMDFFHWEAPYELKKQIVECIFRDYISFFERSKLDSFVDKYKDESVSFFTEIKNDIDKNYIKNSLNQLEYGDIKTFIDKCHHKKGKQISISKLFELAEQRLLDKTYSIEGVEWQL